MLALYECIFSLWLKQATEKSVQLADGLFVSNALLPLIFSFLD